MTSYYDLVKNDTLLIADKESLSALINTEHENLITDIYKKVLVTPGIYDYFIKNLDINGIKSFNKSFKEIEFKASRTAIASIIETEGILTEDEAFAMLSCMANRMDALIDDPRKAKIFALHRINVIRPGDLATAAVITKNIRKRR